MKEVSKDILEAQVEQLLTSSAPTPESASRIRFALTTPKVSPDRLAIARVDAALRKLGLEFVSSSTSRPRGVILAEIEALETERRRLAANPEGSDAVEPDEALDWLAGLGELWRDTTDDGRRALVVAIFERLGSIAGTIPGSHRIVSVTVTEDAEAHGLVIALPIRLHPTKPDASNSSAGAISWDVDVVGRDAWIAHADNRRRALPGG